MEHKYQAHYNHILDWIDAEGYGENPVTEEEKIKFLARTFRSEYGWSIERYGPFRALQEWLAGLPSSINTPFYNHHILEYAVKVGSLPKDYTDNQGDKVIETWFPFIAMRIFEMFRKHGEFV